MAFTRVQTLIFVSLFLFGVFAPLFTSCHSFKTKNVCLSNTISPLFQESPISTNGSTTCSVHNGGISCWGAGTFGQLGNGAMLNSLTPVSVSGSSDARAVRVGWGFLTAGFACGLINCSVKCWGDNSAGELGDSMASGASSGSPAQVIGLTTDLITSLGSGGTMGTSMCVLDNGVPKCWGSNGNRELGDTTTTQRNSPITVTVATTPIQAISIGFGTTCVITNGGAKCWGDNTYGQLGDNQASGNNSNSSIIQVSGLTSGVTSISSGTRSGCAVVNGGVWCWGDNKTSQLGTGTSSSTCVADSCSLVPVNVGITSGATAVAAAGDTFGQKYSACAIVNGGAKCWGDNTSGQLGNGSIGGSSTTPADVVGLTSGVTAITVGGNTACAIANGLEYCWGNGSQGALGNGTSSNSGTPVRPSF